MAHLAQINKDNVVINVIVVPDTVTEDNAQQYGSQIGEGLWVLTSYNENFRKRYAGIGSIYRRDVDAFQPNQYFKGWVFNDDLWDWEPPQPMPRDIGPWEWNQDNLRWEKL